ncbi:hypothetical protein JQC92_22425 [Shewanella sp. 202IG2-18]|uniref:hypothetical protein n=1 Tax=Parashewanella hymeniacidonis TaxID=2807618 RepID=UPI00195F872E|nr:hypothetical protein [Parashewanella hymeniacidonis]MBM7074727.1 hypothetical protein [Parashewanella hymeniacidonis]
MESPEFAIITLNLIIVLVAYLSVYPRVAGNNFNKISFYDIFASGLALTIVGFQFWNTGYEFNLLVFKVNWFWYTLATYGAIEIPVILWYFKNNNVAIKIKS